MTPRAKIVQLGAMPSIWVITCVDDQEAMGVCAETGFWVLQEDGEIEALTFDMYGLVDLEDSLGFVAVMEKLPEETCAAAEIRAKYLYQADLELAWDRINLNQKKT